MPRSLRIGSNLTQLAMAHQWLAAHQTQLHRIVLFHQPQNALHESLATRIG